MTKEAKPPELRFWPNTETKLTANNPTLKPNISIRANMNIKSDKILQI